MATPTPRRTVPPSAETPAVEIVDPRWLLKALGLAVAAAVVCAYLAVCLLVYMGFRMSGGLTPVAAVARTPAADGIAFDAVQFDAGAAGKPRLTGWWIASGSTSAPTILFLHGDGASLAGSEAKLALLHRLNVNLFAIDYRGYGQSEGPHPSEARMREDAAAALDYLLVTRHIPAASIVVEGVGIGASLAAQLGETHPEVAAVILDNPDPGAVDRPLQSSRSAMLPMRLLVGRPFDIAAQLSHLKQPKLLISGSRDERSEMHANGHLRALFGTALDPRISVTLAGTESDDDYRAAVSRFLGEYVRPAP